MQKQIKKLNPIVEKSNFLKTNSFPKISIITVVYNNAKTLDRCIQSVINQTYKNIEYIVIDGGSTDGTVDIIKRYESKIDYWVSEPDDGIYAAMNKGIKKASGEYINFMNSDDCFYSNDSLKQLAPFLKLGKDYVISKAKVIEKKSTWIKCINSKISWVLMPFSHQGLFVKKNVLNSIGLFNTQYKLSADYDLALKLYLKNYQEIKTDIISANFYNSGRSIQNRSKGIAEDLEIQMNLYGRHLNFSISDLKELKSANIKMHRDFKSQVKDLNFLAKIKLNLENTPSIKKTALYTKFLVDHYINKPYISIICPIYNKAHSLEKAIKALTNQTLHNIELIFIDDDSTDNSYQLLKNFSWGNQFLVTYLKNEKSIGLNLTRNKGLTIAKGKYIGFIDMEEIVTKNMFALMIVNAMNSDADIVIYETQIKELKGKNILHTENYNDSNSNQVLKNYLEQYPSICASACNKIYNRKFLIENNIEFPDSYCSENQVFLLDCFFHAKKTIIINNIMLLWIKEEIDKIINTGKTILKKFISKK